MFIFYELHKITQSLYLTGENKVLFHSEMHDTGVLFPAPVNRDLFGELVKINIFYKNIFYVSYGYINEIVHIYVISNSL